jgi:dipeptidyl aminopeptidase/acylaminoacyl peptidase
MIIERSLDLVNASGDPFSADLRYREGPGALPAVIICHGFTAHKDWGPFPYFGQRFAERGFASIVVNFSHNGIGRTPGRFSELQKFERNTIGKEVEDLRAAVDAVTGSRAGTEIIDTGRVAVVGHSRGGGVAILEASHDARVKVVAAWSTIATFYRYTEHQREEWEQRGFHSISIKGSPSRLRYGVDVLRDLEEGKKAYDLHDAVRRLRVPLLLVHGGADMSVRSAEAEELYEVSDKSRTELVILDKVGHSYGAKHPFTESTPAVDEVVDMTARWITQHL